MGQVIPLRKKSLDLQEKRLEQMRQEKKEEDDRRGLMIGLRNGILLAIPLWTLVIVGVLWLF